MIGKPNNFFLTQQRFVYSLSGTHDESKVLYVVNFYQSIFQKVLHPFYSEDNEDGIHDNSVYVDPKQILVVYDFKLKWAQLKIESLLSQNASIISINEKDEKKLFENLKEDTNKS